MPRIEHSDRLRRILGLVFYISLAVALMVFVLDGAGWRLRISSLPPSVRPYEVIELKKIKPKKSPGSESRAPRSGARTGLVDAPVRARPPAHPGDTPGAQKPGQDSLSRPDAGTSPAPLSPTGAGARAPVADGAPVADETVRVPPPASGQQSGARQESRGALTGQGDSGTAGQTGRPGWVVQVASYLRQSNALGLQKKLSQNFDRVYIETADIGQQRYYRIKIGPLADEEEAKKTQRRLRTFGIIETRIDLLPALPQNQE